MSTSLRRAHGKGDKTREYVAAVRRGGQSDGTIYVGAGYLYCTSCGGSTISRGDFALIAGVAPRDVTAFLERTTIRADKAERIRANLASVIE